MKKLISVALLIGAPVVGFCGTATCDRTQPTGFTILASDYRWQPSDLVENTKLCLVVRYTDPLRGSYSYVPGILVGVDGDTAVTTGDREGNCFKKNTSSTETFIIHNDDVTFVTPDAWPPTTTTADLDPVVAMYAETANGHWRWYELHGGEMTSTTVETDRWQVPDTIALERGATDDEDTGPTFDGPVGSASGTLQYHDTSHTGDEDAPHIVNLTTGADDAGTINPGDKWGVRLRGNTPGQWTGTITAALTCP